MLTYVTAITGVILGSGSLTLGIYNYLRDRPKIKIRLQWNMQSSQQSDTFGLITITNVGRRPAHISHVCLILPKPYKVRVLLLLDSSKGQKLSEGDPPARFVVPHDVQSNYSKDLNKIRAQVEDSTGKVYSSKYPKMPKTCQTIETE